MNRNMKISSKETRNMKLSKSTSQYLVILTFLGTVVAGDSNVPLIVNQPKQAVSCDQAYTQCALRKVCAPALKAYNDDCQDLINNRTSKCSPKCLKAMIALRSSEEGDDLVNCDCQENEYCLQSKQMSLECRPQVEQAVDPKTVVSCSTASWICLADQLCSTALDYYYRNCQSLLSQRYCSMRCNNSLSILYRQPKASKLINCQCDGSEEFPCVKYKTYTEWFCLNKLPPDTQTSSANINFEEDNHSNNYNFNNNDDNNHEQATEDDSFNLTNDPETVVLERPDSSFNNFGFGSGNFNDEDEYEDAKATARSSGEGEGGGGGGGGSTDEESTSVINRIQKVEENWIPLISGRYFTNLHQQQQHIQQQQQQQQQVSSTTTSSSSKQRKSQKNVKQKSKSNSTNGHHHDSRRRFSRVLMFASTSSSAGSTHIRTPLLTVWATTCLVLVLNLVVYPLGPHIVFIRLLLH